MFNGKIHYQWSFSIANCLFTRGYYPLYILINPIKSHGKSFLIGKTANQWDYRFNDNTLMINDGD
jgi:hypothetical protein